MKKIIMADKSYAEQIAQLRVAAYYNSRNYTIIDELKFKNYCRWNKRDETGTVLLALNENEEAICTLRGNVYSNREEFEENNITFCGHIDDDFVQYPVLDMSIAATLPAYGKNNLLSVLRYHMYALHKDNVKSITGVAAKNSGVYKMLEAVGYEFKDVSNVREEMVPDNQMVIARLLGLKIDGAMQYLNEKYAERIKEFQLSFQP